MQTSIGVFATRPEAENAVRELIDVKVPREAISFLTPEVSAEESTGVAKTMGAFVGGAVAGGAGLSAGLAAATLLVPGVGPILAIGIGAAALLGVGGAAAGHAAGRAIEESLEAEESEHRPDFTFFRKVLHEHHSVVVVRAETEDLHQKACGVLDRLGIHSPTQEGKPSASKMSTREVSDITVISLNGRLALGQGSGEFRNLVHQLVGQGRRKFLIDLADVTYIDSSGLGELVGAMTTVRNAHGAFRLTKLSSKVSELLRMTHLDKVFEVKNDEAEAIRSFVA